LKKKDLNLAQGAVKKKKEPRWGGKKRGMEEVLTSTYQYTEIFHPEEDGKER